MAHTLRVSKNDDGQQWAEDLVRRVGRAIKKARRGKSAAWLSDRTEQLGYRVSPTVIAKLDSGHRGSVLSVAELWVLAAALGIPPALLLFPTFPDGAVEVLPGVSVSTLSARECLCGDAPIPTKIEAEGISGHIRRPNRGVGLVGTVAARARAENALGNFRRMELEEGTPPDRIEWMIETYKEELRRLEIEIGDAKALLWGNSAEEESDG
jgi:hypothetical protein